jgi:hypothetical protein
MGKYTIKIKVVNAKEAQCNYMTYTVTYRSNIFKHFGSDSNTVHCYIFYVPVLQLEQGAISYVECTL